jgi:hypothetical protein
MPKIFISYRRDDSEFVADAIYNEMKIHFGEGNVFIDVGEIPFGVDFRKFLRDQIAAHDVVLVLIGPKWADIMRQRASRADDFVRIEIESALALQKLIIPVMVMKLEQMPDFATLPSSISDLSWRNAARIRREPDFKPDCKRIADNIHRVLGGVQPQLPPDPMARLQTLLPAPFDLIGIPAGKVKLSTGKSFDVPAFTIGKYPVTNAHYRPFVEKGYDEQRWWTAEGWNMRQNQGWTQPRFWDDARWNRDDHPVVGVSWYEAVAYCRWLSGQTGAQVVLPTEQMWQRAAQGDRGWKYPWGNKWDGARCNNSVGDYNSSVTTPVTHYAGQKKGDSPFGVSDMAGNVWEWCITDYNTGEQDANQSATNRVLRGGAWGNSDADNFAAAFRYWDSPDSWYSDVGFRFALL